MNNALVLITEDESDIVDILRRYLEREEFRTVSASDGDTGLSHHMRLEPDLIVLDVKLPDLDGYEILANIHQRGDTPVIMVTALADLARFCTSQTPGWVFRRTDVPVLLNASGVQIHHGHAPVGGRVSGCQSSERLRKAMAVKRPFGPIRTAVR